MFEWINSQTAEATDTLRTLTVFFASVGFLVSSAQAKWTASRMIIAAVVAAVVIAVVFNINAIAKLIAPIFG
jgi:hypothetical protein